MAAACSSCAIQAASRCLVERASQATAARASKAQPAFLGQALGINTHATPGSQKVASTGIQLVAAAAARGVRCAAAAVEAAAAPPAGRPSAAELAQTVVELAAEGTLVTLAHGGTGSTLTGDDQPLPATWPLACHAFFAPDPRGAPSCCSPTPAAPPPPSPPTRRRAYTCRSSCRGSRSRRCRCTGDSRRRTMARRSPSWRRRGGGASPTARRRWAAAMAARSPRSSCWTLTACSWRLMPTRRRVDLPRGVPECGRGPLREVAAGIVADFNREHWQDLRRFPAAFAALPDLQVDDASLIWIDRLGFDLACSRARHAWVRGGGRLPCKGDGRARAVRRGGERGARGAVSADDDGAGGVGEGAELCHPHRARCCC
ncbi:hypothetical protein CLOM_g10826 [Closterium sp. NIES-68]|nr:hypothetical protein CLOM_g10826 [Closterium sp. NIES-68]